MLHFQREMSVTWAREILNGTKKLLQLDKVKWIQQIPNYPELSVQRMWKELRKDKDVTVYFPDYSEKRFPNKSFLMNIVNTIKPNSIINAVKQIKLEREKKKKEVKVNSIEITCSYLNLLKEFQCLGENQKMKGLGRLK